MGLSDVIAASLFESAEEMAEMSARDLRRKLRANDCVELRQKGSHLQVKCGGCQSTVPVHGGNKDIALGTLKSIERSLGACLSPNWTRIEFLDDEDATLRIVEGVALDEGKKKHGGGSESLSETVRKIGVFTKTQGGVIKAYANRVAEHAGEAAPQSREAVSKLQGLMAQLDATITQVAALAAEVERKG